MAKNFLHLKKGDFIYIDDGQNPRYIKTLKVVGKQPSWPGMTIKLCETTQHNSYNIYIPSTHLKKSIAGRFHTDFENLKKIMLLRLVGQNLKHRKNE